MILDVANDDQFLVFFGEITGEFAAQVGSEFESIRLRSLIDDTSIEIERIEFALAQARGDIVRTTRDGVGLPMIDTIDLLGFHKPEGSKVTLGELKTWEAQNKKLKDAAVLSFYIKRFRKRPCATDYYTMLDFINGELPDAKKEGLDHWKPSPSTITRAMQRSPTGSLIALVAQNGKQKNKKKFPEWVYEIANQAVRRYWTNADTYKIQSCEWFDRQFYKTLDARVALGEPKIKPPTHTTIYNWINEARSDVTVGLKLGIYMAYRQLGGRRRGITALRPLDWVLIDHTLSDIWVVVLSSFEDDNGQRRVLAIKRPWMVTAIDLYSRMNVVGSYLSFEPPSVRTVMECIRRIMTPKIELINAFRKLPEATDGFGFPQGIVLDNALENVMVSMQMALEGLGIAVEYAPRHTPEYKAWVERYNSTVKTMQRSLPGGIPLELADGDLDPRKFAKLTLEDVTSLMDHVLVTKYHSNQHEGIGIPPGLKWLQGLREFGRHTVDNARTTLALTGKYKKVACTAEGIRIDGQIFSDPDIISMLMSNNAPFMRLRRQRRGKTQTRTLDLHSFRNPADCSHIYVIDMKTRQLVRVPNRDELIAAVPVSFAWAKAQRAELSELSKEFYSREDRAAWAYDFQVKLENMLARANHGDGKAIVRLVEDGRQIVNEALTFDVQHHAVPPSISGLKGTVQRHSAFEMRDEQWEPPPGRKPGKAKKDDAKPATTINAKAVKTDATVVQPKMPKPKSSRPVIEIGDSEARLDQLARLLDAVRGNVHGN